MYREHATWRAAGGPPTAGVHDLAARHGAPPSYPRPDLEPVPRDTYGVTIWHEQVIDLLAVMTGCDHALPEVARRALGDEKQLPKIGAWFQSSASRRAASAPSALPVVAEACSPAS
ncbi:hypothetical protein ACFCV8_07985 [Streptomyces sp. NPDC056347]|uniref:hypothetical protein n=1 Tax=Streptomyces sp. NPDC056347 TaxID=3345790 RepID=UPI0035D81768